MRLSPLFLLLSASAFAGARAQEDEEDNTRENTYFNSIKVPPITELTPDTFGTVVNSSTYTLIKYFR
jgi:protein disulfide-isomerase